MVEIVTPFAGLVDVTVTVRLPLAVSASVTVAIVELVALEPATRDNPLAAVIVGAWLFVTVTLRVAVAVAVPSLTWRVKVALVAPVAAAIFAVIVPFALAMVEIVTPLEGLADVTVTVRLPLGVSASVTVAIVELVALEPATRDNPVAAVIVGAWLGGGCGGGFPGITIGTGVPL
ncbi:MAG: hypothetical protein EBZ36_03990 [Acidobacteria bacterium]|nr:hypothetical protein [Acidobacteriota bacterium]